MSSSTRKYVQIVLVRCIIVDVVHSPGFSHGLDQVVSVLFII